MQRCANCATPLAEGAVRCPNCGRAAIANVIPLAGGIIFGTITGMAVYAIWLVTWLVVSGSQGTANHCAVVLAFHVITLAIGIAGGVRGIALARRGETGIAALLILPAIGLAAPAVACIAPGLAACR